MLISFWMSQKHKPIVAAKGRKRHQELRSEILACLKNGRRLDVCGYQGDVYVTKFDDKKVVIKSAAGRGIANWINRWMLRSEYNIYLRLDGIKGVPRCFGFFLNRYLVLEYVDAQTMREVNISDRESFLVELLEIIKAVHSRGVAHGDLKRKDNILITRDSKPYLVDFGVSVARKQGFRPLNYFWHRFCHQHDFNAWLKHKYGRDLVNMSHEDTCLYRPLWSERISRIIKRSYKKLFRLFRQRSRREKWVTQKDRTVGIKDDGKNESGCTCQLY